MAPSSLLTIRFVNPTAPCGTRPPPVTNTPPAKDQQDPHEYPRRSFDGRRQKDAFLRIGGKVINVCGDRPCYAGSWTGP